MRKGLLTDLHTPILHVGIDEWDPGSGLEGVEGRGVQVGVVLVPGDSDLLVLGCLGAEVPDGMAWRHKGTLKEIIHLPGNLRLF